MDDSLSPEVLRRAVLQRLESLQRAGVSELPRPKIQVAAVAGSAGNATVPDRDSSTFGSPRPEPARPTPPPGRQVTHISPQPADMAPVRAAAAGSSLFVAAGWDGAPTLPAEQRQAALDMICGQVRGCERCRELATTRTQTVFGLGNASARLCFLGEAPGADEDAQGEPFVGRAGQLLNKIIEACTLRRQDVYILNTVKCRPPGNRNPLPTETANCREYLDRQLEIIQPEFICCLGLVAAQALLNTEQPMGRLRKRFFDYRGSRVLCTYHPAYLLRNPAAKKDVWEDMQLLMAEMGIDLKSK